MDGQGRSSRRVSGQFSQDLPRRLINLAKMNGAGQRNRAKIQNCAGALLQPIPIALRRVCGRVAEQDDAGKLLEGDRLGDGA